MRKMPIGIQTFEDIITDGYAYVDKTAWVHRLANEGKYFFLGRPRRFGKSLLLSTLRSYFEGRRDLFKGLAIEALEKDWTPHPVLHIDLNVASYKDVGDLEKGLDANLRDLEEKWGIDAQDTFAPTRFHRLIRTACEKSGRKVVVLVDEYDRPLINTMERGIANEEIRAALKGFYGVLKSADRWLRFTLLTGVTKFSKVAVNSDRLKPGSSRMGPSAGCFATGDRSASLFSDLNMLRDISLGEAYAGICGISARELEESFGPELTALAEKNGISRDAAVAEMKKRYDGYHFCEGSEGMFNPFSVLNTLADGKFAYYWFRTGTPTFLIEQMKRAAFDPLRFTEGVTISARAIDDYRVGGGNPVPLLYQSGYLTIAGYDGKLDEYALDFPNEEVRYGFLEELLPAYTYGSQYGGDFFVGSFVKDLRAGDADAFMKRMRSFFANIPYDLNDETERHYQLVFYLVFTLLGQYTRAELHSARGRADAVVEAEDAVYVFEFKLNGTAEEALRQIDGKGYAVPYEAGGRRVVKIGAAFDKAERNIGSWLVKEDPRD